MVASEVHNLRIVVVGAGVAGLSAALMLARKGFERIDVYEASSDLGFVGAGIQLAPNMARILDHLGVWESVKQEAVALRSASIREGTTDGELGCVNFDYIEKTYGYPHMVGHRASLVGALYAGCKAQSSITFHFSTKVSSCDLGTTSFVATPCGGVPRWIAADIILACDGIKSSTRAAILDKVGWPGSGVVDSGQAAYRIMIPRGKMEKDPDLLELIERDGVVRWIGEGRQIMAYPIDGKRIYNVSTAHPDINFASAPTSQYTTRGSIDKMHKMFEDFCPKVHKLLKLVQEDSICEWKLRLHAPLPTWVYQSVGLLGDACHPTLPHMAQGAAQAIEDGCSVGIALARLPDTKPESINKALRIYENTRKSRAETLVELAAANGRVMKLGSGKEKEARDAMYARLRNGSGPVPDRWADKEVQKSTYGFDCAQATETACALAGW